MLLPCPEQHAWGGVLKRWTLALYGRRVLRSSAVRRVVVAVARWCTELDYRRMARRVAAQIEDYIANGFDVVEVMGVGASPSCGVDTTLDLDRAVAAIARGDRHTLSAAVVNEHVVAANATARQGMFVAALRRRLARRKIDVPFREHDLLAELRTQRADATGRVRPPRIRGFAPVRGGRPAVAERPPSQSR